MPNHPPTPTAPPDMVYVPAGEFIMGSLEGEGKDDEQPQHTMYLDAFYIDKTEVTNAQYRACVEAEACNTPSDTTHYGDADYAQHPVVSVDWYQAKAYCEWAGKRLPTEAEREKAARGDLVRREYPWGDTFDPEKANLSIGDEKVGDTSPVGICPGGASPYGVMDLSGNVWEWCSSLYRDYPYDPEDGREDLEAQGRRVLRGGSWATTIERYTRCSSRLNAPPSPFRDDIGFRVLVSAALSP